jgi:uncharacterized membrane-anchored protein
MSIKAYKIVAAATAVLILLLVNGLISRNEKLLIEGRSLYLQLAPVDPRSLMQGDYMTLNYELANQLREQLSELNKTNDHEGQAVIAVDTRGVGQRIQIRESAPAQRADQAQILLNYRRSGWQVHLATDAFFFEEGQGERYARARYGHFRTDGKGRALLVELCDEQLLAL